MKERCEAPWISSKINVSYTFYWKYISVPRQFLRLFLSWRFKTNFLVSAFQIVFKDYTKNVCMKTESSLKSHPMWVTSCKNFSYDYIFQKKKRNLTSFLCRSVSILNVKGTVSVISSNPQCKVSNARFTTTVRLQALSEQVLTNINVYDFENWLWLAVGFLRKWLAHF